MGNLYTLWYCIKLMYFSVCLIIRKTLTMLLSLQFHFNASKLLMLSETETLAYFFLHGTAQFDSTCLEHLFIYFLVFYWLKLWVIPGTWYWNGMLILKLVFIKKLSFNVDRTILRLSFIYFIYLFHSDYVDFMYSVLGGTLSEQNWTALLNSETK